jgi:hypothetical protein
MIFLFVLTFLFLCLVPHLLQTTLLLVCVFVVYYSSSDLGSFIKLHQQRFFPFFVFVLAED